MTAEPKKHDIAALAQRLQDATACHAKAHRTAEGSRRDETAALNRLNECQKDFDTAVAALHSEGHRDTNWARALNVKGCSA